MLVHTYQNLGKTAKPQAEMFRAVLAVDRGYTSEITPIKGGFKVTASDGKFVHFMIGGAK